MTDRLTHWQTNRSVCNNRRSAQWISKILLLSTATTSIYWSSRLDRSDQLQQSAAIFSCIFRRVAVYVETLQYSLEESVSHRRTRQVTQQFTYLLTHKLFSSCIRRYLVPRVYDWVMPGFASVMFTPFTGANFISNCLLQPMLHINHPLLQFIDITEPLLGTAALFSRSCSRMIQIWALKAASYLAR